MDGLPAGQLSFLLPAGSDTTNNSQPQEMNDTCRCLCWDLSPTVLHILNGCPMALDQSRYTWRHDGVLKKFDHFVRPQLPSDECLLLTYQG